MKTKQQGLVYQILDKVMPLLLALVSYTKVFLLQIPSTIYDIVISRTLTNYSYQRLVNYINKHQVPKGRKLRVLDIGVGTAVPLHFIWEQLPLEIEVMGVDIDHSYIEKAQRLFKNIKLSGGSRKIDLFEMNFYEMDENKYGKFDIIVFSSSFMLMPERERALQISKDLLVKGGKIMFILTLQQPSHKNHYLSSVAQFVKPKIKYITTIDFGQITYEDDFERLLKEADLVTTHKERLSKDGINPTKIFRIFFYETILAQ